MASLAPCTATVLLAPSDHAAVEETSPAGRREFPGEGNDLKELYKENVSMHIACGIFFARSVSFLMKWLPKLCTAAAYSIWGLRCFFFPPFNGNYGACKQEGEI